MRLQKVDPAKADAELRAALRGQGGVMTSNDDNAVLAWPGDGVFDNPWAEIFPREMTTGYRRRSWIP
jgi:hypothetical protein